MMQWLIIRIVRLWTRARAQGVPGAGQRIYVANHTSHLDVALILSLLPAAQRARTRPVAAEEYWTAGPLRRWLIHSIFRGVLVDRERFQMNPLERVAEALRQGDSLIYFPEGTRGPGCELRPLKPGIYHLARWFPQVEIIPVWIDRTRRVVSFGLRLNRPEPFEQDTFLAALRDALQGLHAG